MNKALLPLLLCCFIFSRRQEKMQAGSGITRNNPKEKENKPVPAGPPAQEPDIMQKPGSTADGNKAGAVRSHSVSRRG